MKSYRAEPYSRYAAEHGEGPLWDDRSRTLLWVDLTKGRMLESVSVEQTRVVHEWQNECCFLGLVAGGGRLAALSNALLHLPASGQEPQSLCGLPVEPNMRSNDGKVGPHGHIWAGVMDRSVTEGVGSLYRITPRLEISIALSDLTVPNGLGWSREDGAFYFIDSADKAVSVIEQGPYGLAKRSVVNLSGLPGVPDGMSVNVAGRLWIAHFGGSRVSCWHPKSGEQVAEVLLPVSQVTSCTFGGDGLSTLYITTSQLDLSAAELADQPDAGKLFTAEVDAVGFSEHRFHMQEVSADV